jgi:Tol biopolymer transport system component
VKGKFEWTDSKTLQFIPTEPYQPGIVYSLTFTPGALAKNNAILKRTQSWKIQIRQPLIVYLVVDQDKGRLWTVAMDSGESTPLTVDMFKIYDFGVSPDGEFIIFSAFNDQKGIDLWRVSRAGGNAVLQLQCGADRCSNPAISPDGRRVAYVREVAGPTPSVPYGTPRIYMFDLDTKQNAPLYEDQQIIGLKPSWSPDGTRLASYDNVKNEFRLLDLTSASQTTISSQTGGTATWLADSSAFVYTDIATNDFGPHTRIREAKMSIHDVTTVFGEKDKMDYYYGSLAWSPASDTLVMSIRSNKDKPEETLLSMSPATLDGWTIADQPGYIYDSASWDPWGKMLIFEAAKLKEAYDPEIDLWQPGMEAPRIVAKGIMPHWLP